MVSFDETIRSALASLPPPLARRLGSVHFTVLDSLGRCSSRWTRTGEGIEVELSGEDTNPHDCALELLTCLGQGVWESARRDERRAWLELLSEEMEAGVRGEIDEPSLDEKRLILSSSLLARSPRRLEKYARAAYAGTLAEYLHSLWHRVTVRRGPDFLPAIRLHGRFALFRRWFPQDPGRNPHGVHFSCRIGARRTSSTSRHMRS